MAKSQKQIIEQIFNGGALMEGYVWRLKLSPPGHQYHQPEDIVQIEKAVAQVQSGLSALRRSLKRQKRASDRQSRSADTSAAPARQSESSSQRKA